MTIGKVVRFSTGKIHKDCMYVQLRNGSVWKLKHPVTESQVSVFKENIAKGNTRIRLENYLKVRPLPTSSSTNSVSP
jgi:hypothetical protein